MKLVQVSLDYASIAGLYWRVADYIGALLTMPMVLM